MASGLRQVLRQGQQLVMTQQLQQAIKLLQLSSLDLAEFVEQQVESNPLLEFGESLSAPEPDLDDAAPSEPSQAEAEAAPEGPYENLFTNDDRDLSPRAAPDEGPGGGSIRGPVREGGEEGGDPIARLAERLSLREHLGQQLGTVALGPQHQLIGRYLIDLVDEAGYLRGDVADIADWLGCDAALVEETLRTLQTFDPSGVCARSVAECLAIQLRDRDRFDPAMQTLVANLEALAEGRIDWLKRQCGVSDEDFADMLGELRSLDPKPGLVFDSGPTEVVVPDLFVARRGDGSWAIELNADVLPRVLVNTRYYAEVRSATRSKEERAFLSDCFSNASWLVKALDQRAKTILKVASELVRRQEGFFLSGVAHMRPLNLRQVADAIGMHESTVSRVTAGKYLSCSRGTFELKYFFTAAIAAAEGGESHSAEAVRHRIRELIDAEDTRNILSDDRIVELLRDSDIDIARRTVAKYREAMHIPSSVQRRRLKSVRGDGGAGV
ncbi:MAG: RNA polymerase factor sigma-54 [Alphaproteobacteria bacterium]|nr:RNA polymerase factor sigma-54 [Alphaproteobacteria bacterium]